MLDSKVFFVINALEQNLKEKIVFAQYENENGLMSSLKTEERKNFIAKMKEVIKQVI